MQKLYRLEVKKELKKIKTWKVRGKELKKEFIFKNFLQAIKFINKIALLAEKADHHPDIFIHNYKKVAISLTTHAAGGITQKDFDLARKIGKIKV